MVKVLMYTTAACPYCAKARNLLQRKGIEFDEVAIDRDPPQREAMVARSGRETVPQIFIGEHHVGGYDDLTVLDATDELEELLQA